ncbi:hypothetical protein CPSG_00237 [Coccidioides posadasii str. Silveira]|uniref:Uncharacterized protein n=1 Tax=Coccidioides posadasii (strain RMSCC 757 / Silveira) TaxID=443226 RepID=E9CR03_COCPS|nr:hypothetical protein CPSG_00237 [Coccidioides posadasii str. Silveira]
MEYFIVNLSSLVLCAEGLNVLPHLSACWRTCNAIVKAHHGTTPLIFMVFARVSKTMHNKHVGVPNHGCIHYWEEVRYYFCNMNFDCFQELYSVRTEIYVAYCKYISDGFIPPGIAEAGSITRSLLLAAVAPKSWLLGFGMEPLHSIATRAVGHESSIGDRSVDIQQGGFGSLLRAILSQEAAFHPREEW